MLFPFLFYFTCVFIDVYSLSTCIAKNPKGCTTALVGGTRPPCFFHLLDFWSFRVRLSCLDICTYLHIC